MNFKYDFEHIKHFKGLSKKELLTALKDHDYNSFAYSYYTGLFNYAIVREQIGFHKVTENENDKRRLRSAFLSGLFHDIGKLGMEPEFINYRNKFNVSMFTEMKKHTIGGRLLLEESTDAEKELIQTSAHHHCNFDGSGYPGGLFRDDIPFYARLTRISDSADAFLTNRCYKEGGPAQGVYDDLKNYEGASYDPMLLTPFGRVHNNIMDECHRIGEDRPHRNLYIDFLEKIYIDIQGLDGPDDVFDVLEEL